MHRILTSILASLLVTPAFSETAEIHSTMIVSHDHGEWGGLSGIDVLDDAQTVVLVSDKGSIWKGAIERNDSGMLLGLAGLEHAPILTSRGEPVEEYNIDAEAIDHDEEGNFYISFESNSRVSRFAKWNGAATLIPNAEAFAGFGFNSGPEAMTIGEEGEIWLAPERSGDLERPFPLFQFDGKNWRQEIGIDRKPPYLLVGMDYDPKTKRLYILERDLHLGFRFHNRVRVFDYHADGLINEATLWESDAGEFGNLEGIAYFERDGRRYLLLVSDNNNLPFFANHFVELKLLPS